MSKRPAALPLFGDAYLADTTHLTTEEHGAYLLLLIACWRQDDCALPDDDRKLARITGLTPRKWKSIRSTIIEFFDTENGRISQARLRKEHDFVCKKSEVNRQAANARWGAQDVENKQSRGMRTQCERNAPPPPPTDVLVAKAPNTSQRGRAAYRLPENWRPDPLPDKVRALAAQWPEGRLERELDGFRDYWMARARDAARSDWDRVWHNRIRDIHDRVMREASYGRQRTPATKPRDGVAAALDRRLGQPANEVDGRTIELGGGDSGGTVARIAAMR